MRTSLSGVRVCTAHDEIHHDRGVVAIVGDVRAHELRTLDYLLQSSSGERESRTSRIGQRVISRPTIGALEHNNGTVESAADFNAAVGESKHLGRNPDI